MANIEIGGRLHSTATGNVVTGANEVLDDAKNKKQSVINAEVDETIGDDNTEGTIKGRIKTAEGKLDTLNGDSSTSGSVAKAVADAKTELIGGATSDGNTLKKVEDRTATLETAVGSNGSVDQRIATAKSEVIGDAASDYNTLGKLEDKIQAEASARQDAITAETNRATTRENQIYDLIHTPEQHYVTVATYAELANIASPSDDTIYRVSSYNGKTSQVDNTVYSEYGYDGTNFVFLCVKSQIDEVYDISAHHSNNTYVDLAAALDGGNNIPQELRRGGMSIKFVQSSDNKYVQFRLMSDSWSIDTDEWALCSEDVLVENPEFIDVKTDKEGKILWAIKTDGTIYWGAGIPQQVINYVENVIYKLGLNDVNKITIFLGELINGDNLSYLLNRKVDKEDGKSLINSSYSSAVSLEENNAFIDVTTDSEGNVLSGRKKDGKLYEPNGIETPEIYIDSIKLSSKALDGLTKDLEKNGFTPGTIPTKTSQLTNDSGFITNEDVPTATSDLTNDSGFVTSSQIPQPSTSVIQDNNNPVTSGAVYNAILQAQIEAANVIINTGLPFIAVAASTVAQEIKNVCQYVCDGIDDQEEINEAIQFVKNSGGGRVFLTRGKYFISSPIIFEGDIELCGEGMGAQFGGDPLLRETYHATYLQSTNNNDIIQVFSGRGASIHDLSISGHGAEKLETENWGVHIKGWIDICNFYNLNISDCYVAIGNDAYTDVYNIYNCSIQRNILAVLIYKPIYVRFHDNIICENFGLETYTGSFKDSTSASDPYEDPVTYSLMGVVAIIKGSRVVVYNNTFMRSGFIFLFNPQRKMFRDGNRYPMSHISICNSASSVCVNSNLFQTSDGPSITIQEYTDGARNFSIKSNVFQEFGQGYTEEPTEDNPTYTNTNYRNRKYASGIYINANATASEIESNYFIRDTQYNEYAVYEEDIESPDSGGKFRLMVHGNSMVRLLGDSTNQKVRIATGCTTNKIDYNIINDF